MQYSQGEIILVPFPYSDLSAIKKRPVLILSNDLFNSSKQDLIVAAITSKSFRDNYSCEITDEDLEIGFMPEKSVIKLSKLFTINKNMIIKKFSKIRNDKFKEIKNTLITILSTE